MVDIIPKTKRTIYFGLLEIIEEEGEARNSLQINRYQFELGELRFMIERAGSTTWERVNIYE